MGEKGFCMEKKSRFFSFLLTVCIIQQILLGCSRTSTDEKARNKPLWVVTEQSTSDGMNLQAQIIAERMEQSYPGLTVQLEILPLTTREREIRIKQLRSQIMSGKGPDVYLLPTGSSLILDYSVRATVRENKSVRIEPLLLDVPLVMESGVFADIQPFFQEDLDAARLREEILSAGVINGKRYVLPLRFTMPVILTDPEAWPRHGLNTETMNAGMEAIAGAALKREDPAVSIGLRLPADMSLLPVLGKVENGEISPSVRELADYMRLYQQMEAIAAGERERLISDWNERYKSLYLGFFQKNGITDPNKMLRLVEKAFDMASFNSAREYSQYNMYWRTEGLPLYVCRLPDVLETLAIAKHEGTDIQMFPLRTMDHKIVADITYYGAVGRSCKTPELAYEFLRQFLTEEFQWDLYRPRAAKKSDWQVKESEMQKCGQIENSWPTRSDGAVSYLWDSLKYQLKGSSSTDAREISNRNSREIQEIEISERDVPALFWPIDEVRFPVTLPEEESFEHALSLLNEEDGTPTDVDIDALAQQVYQSLWFHLMEG